MKGWGYAFFLTALFLGACSEEKENRGRKGLSLEMGIESYPLGRSIYQIPNFPLSDTAYEPNWSEEAERVTPVSEYASLWNYRWGDFSYYPSQEGYTIFFKRGVVFAHLVNSRGPNNAFDLKNGIYIGMPLDSMVQILGLPKSEPSYFQRYVTDSLSVFTKDYKVTSYCILSPRVFELFCAARFRGAVELVQRSIDTAIALGKEPLNYNALCVDEDRDRYRVQLEYGLTGPHHFDYRSFKFDINYSLGFWFDKSTKKLIQYTVSTWP